MTDDLAIGLARDNICKCAAPINPELPAIGRRIAGRLFS